MYNQMKHGLVNLDYIIIYVVVSLKLIELKVTIFILKSILLKKCSGEYFRKQSY